MYSNGSNTCSGFDIQKVQTSNNTDHNIQGRAPKAEVWFHDGRLVDSAIPRKSIPDKLYTLKPYIDLM